MVPHCDLVGGIMTRAPGEVPTSSPFRLDLRAERLWRGKQPIALRPKAWALLRFLVERPGTLVTKDQMQTAIWGDTVVSDDTVTRTLGRTRPRPHARPAALREAEQCFEGARSLARAMGAHQLERRLSSPGS